MEDTAIEDDPNTNTQLNEKFFKKSEFVFIIDSMKKIYMTILFPPHSKILKLMNPTLLN